MNCKKRASAAIVLTCKTSKAFYSLSRLKKRVRLILGEDMSEQKDRTQKAFNDAELEDIMQEIEGLEKEFAVAIGKERGTEEQRDKNVSLKIFEGETQTGPENGPPLGEKLNALQAQDTSSKMSPRDMKQEMERQAPLGPNTLETPPLKESQPYLSKTNVQNSKDDHMSFTMSFQVGRRQGHLIIDPKKGLTVSLGEAFDLVVTDKGLEVKMPEGATMAVPFTKL